VSFFDENEKAELWGKDLYQHIESVYRDDSKFCVIFVSHSYANKLWPRHELRQAQARAFREKAEYILPVRLEDVELPGHHPFLLRTVFFRRTLSRDETPATFSFSRWRLAVI
jgi:hypothetical protein